MTHTAMQALEDELACWHVAGITANIWWRDDDAIEVTCELKQLAALANAYDFPIMLAVIPANATQELAQLVLQEPTLSAATHGYTHQNNADAGTKKTELTENGSGRTVDKVVDELNRARNIMETLFDLKASQILVPPWNRISDTVIDALPSLGFKLLSTYGDKTRIFSATQINCHIDLMHWGAMRKGKSIALILDELTTCLKTRRISNQARKPIGILSHHLVHDDSAWETCQFLINLFSNQGVFKILGRDDLLEYEG